MWTCPAFDRRAQNARGAEIYYSLKPHGFFFINATMLYRKVKKFDVFKSLKRGKSKDKLKKNRKSEEIEIIVINISLKATLRTLVSFSSLINK